MNEPHPYATTILSGLGASRWYPVQAAHKPGIRRRIFLMAQEKHVYGGTVPYEEIQRRRAKNRVARKSRRINRLRAR